MIGRKKNKNAHVFLAQPITTRDSKYLKTGCKYFTDKKKRCSLVTTAELLAKMKLFGTVILGRHKTNTNHIS